jgi:AmmeMemoRadiSam system protein A
MNARLSPAEREYLLRLAREAIRCAVIERRMPEIDLAAVPFPALREPGACFVTLEIDGELRGCTGTLEAREPLAQNVAGNAVGTALYDFRFNPLGPEEFPHIAIEISVLSPSEPYHYGAPADLLRTLLERRPGVTIQRGLSRATFLPQVWEKLSDPAEFLTHLCLKAGLAPDTWRRPGLEVWLYDVEKFVEE